MELIKLTFTGFVLGATVIIPGFSTATMAVVLNVYDRLINVIVPDVKKIMAAWLFWLPMVVGGIIGIFFSGRVFSILFENYQIPAYWFFIGIIAGSLPVVYSRVQKPSSRLPYLSSAVCCILAILIMVLINVLRPEEGARLYTELTPQVFGLLVLGGALSAIAMITPGISGAFFLLVIGLYQTVLKAVSDLNLLLLLPLVLGAIAGLLGGAAVMRFLLSKAPRGTYGAVLGLVAGSVIVLFPGTFAFETGWESPVIGIIISVVVMIAGFLISLYMGSRKHKPGK